MRPKTTHIFLKSALATATANLHTLPVMNTIRFRRVSATKPTRPAFDRVDLRGRSDYLRESGISWESQDCTVRTLALAAGVPYADAHAACELYGRSQGKRFGWGSMEKAADLLGIFLQPRIRGYRKTVSTWLRELRSTPGRYVLGTRGHAFAVVVGPDGSITGSDSCFVPRAIVTEAYTVKNSEK